MPRGTTPERLRRALRGDLDTIVAKALKKNPAERYASVAEFADDLRRYRRRTSRSARGPTRSRYRAAKFVRRHRRSVSAAVAGAVLMISGLIAFYTVRLARERDRAAPQAAKASRSASC